MCIPTLLAARCSSVGLRRATPLLTSVPSPLFHSRVSLPSYRVPQTLASGFSGSRPQFLHSMEISTHQYYPVNIIQRIFFSGLCILFITSLSICFCESLNISRATSLLQVPAPCSENRVELEILPMPLFWRAQAKDNKGLIEMLQRTGAIKSRKVVEIMEFVDRGLFVPEGEMAYVDSPMPIGYNATISAPHMHGACLELLENHLQPGMHALDVGSGTGYLTAAFALLVGEQGRAVGVEHIPELVALSVKNVKRSKAAHLLEAGCLSLHVGDGREGWPEHAPYDAIHVGAAASKIPHALMEQLKPGGRMVIPVGDVFQDLMVVDKGLDGKLNQWSSSSVRYVPLTSRDSQLRGY